MPGSARSRPPSPTALGVVLFVAACAGACSLPPSEACEAYVACQKAFDDSVDTTAWKEGGSCWVNPRTAAACDAQCVAALDAIADTPDPPEACRR